MADDGFTAELSDEMKQLMERRQSLMHVFVHLDDKIELGTATALEQIDYEQTRNEILQLDEEMRRLSEKP